MQTLRFQKFAGILVMSACFLFSVNTVFASGSLSMTYPSPSAEIFAGTLVTFTVNQSGFTNPTYSIEDNFGGTSLSSSNINNSGQFAWTPTSKDIGSHSFTISASDSLGTASNLNAFLTVKQPTITLGAPQPSASVPVGTSISLPVTVSGLPNPTYAVSDSLGGSLSSSNINASGYLLWTPAGIDVGTHSVVISASDSFGHTISATQIFTISGAPTISLDSLSPESGVVSPGVPLTFTLRATGLSNPTYSVKDSYIPTKISSSNLSSASFSWTPTIDETGTHNLYILAVDSSTGRTVSITKSISVVIPNLTISGGSGSLSLPGGKVTFGVLTNSFTNPTFSLSDTFSGSSVTNSNISSNGYFTWLPTSADIGEHTIVVNVADANSQKGSVEYHVKIQEPTVSIQSIYPSLSIGVGETLSFKAVSLNLSKPAFSVEDMFSGNSSLTHSNINTNGYFSWTPIESDIGTHILHVNAKDAVGQSGFATTTVTVAKTLFARSPNPNHTIVTTARTNLFQFVEPLYFGMENSDVSKLQSRLTEEGVYTGPINGVFGPMTKAGVKSYQKIHGIEQLGNVGPSTRAALNQTKQTMTEESRLQLIALLLSQIRELQAQLAQISGL